MRVLRGKYREYILKPLDDIKREYPEGWIDWNWGMRNIKMRWTINPDMIKIFESGHKWLYKPVEEATNWNYTHKGYNGHYWHESWFEDDKAILKFNDIDFEI
jgi:hypothetical protein